MTTVSGFTPLVCLVDFHHARGPEVERWIGIKEGQDPVAANDWSLLPFLALPDGSHASSEEISYFTLRHGPPEKPTSSVFGIACTRQLDARELVYRPADVTRSSVQKAIVAVVDSPYAFSRIREKLSAVTKAWFAQKDFRDHAVVEQFQESLVLSSKDQLEERDQYVGLSLREIIHEYKHQTLVLFKCCLLQPKMLFFGANCERLCLLQFALISLIPGLIRNLQDCADPKLNTYEEHLERSSSLRTSDRASLLSYMGLPLQLFGKGSLFGPYTPLQQLDILGDFGTKSYIAGSTNTLLLQQRDRYSDVLINLDDHSVNVFSPSLKSPLALSVPDRRWIDFLTQTVNDTWDESNPTRPINHGYAGSEEFIRLQFEEYLLALLSAVKYRLHVERHGDDPKALLSEASTDPASEFGSTWVDAWMRTDNYRIFHSITDSELFDIVEPKHPCAGALTVEDVQRRLAQQVAELHLDERLNDSRDVINKHLATGQQKVSSAFNKIWSDIEVMRENQRKRAEDRKTAASSSTSDTDKAAVSDSANNAPKGPDFAQAQAAVQAAGAKAGAYFSSWGTWAAEKRKTGWKSPRTESPAPNNAEKPPEVSASEDTKPREMNAAKDEPDSEVPGKSQS